MLYFIFLVMFKFLDYNDMIFIIVTFNLIVLGIIINIFFIIKLIVYHLYYFHYQKHITHIYFYDIHLTLSSNKLIISLVIILSSLLFLIHL